MAGELPIQLRFDGLSFQIRATVQQAPVVQEFMETPTPKPTENFPPLPVALIGALSAPVKQIADATAAKTWGLDANLNLAQLAADFYLILDAEQDFPRTPQLEFLKHPLVSLLADQFSRYLDMVIGGELRHANTESRFGSTDPAYEDEALGHAFSWLQKPKARLLARELQSSGTTGAWRGTFWNRWLILRKKHGLALLRRAEEIFNLCDWRSSFGGESWATATHVLLEYLTHKLTPVAFVDTAFGIHHNGNIVFDKVWQVDDLIVVLNVNLNGNLTEVRKFASPEVKLAIGKLRRQHGRS